MRVLIVDDERNIRESLQRLLELEGIDTVTASDGSEAANILRSEAFDAIVADLKMPVMGGQELLERIRDEGYRSPVIMISALGEINDAVKALKTGAVDYLIKPFDPEELIHKIKNAVSNRRREDQIEAGARTQASVSRFIGEGEASLRLKRQIEKIAGTDTTVLISGESGSGKEVVAREIHALSPRAEEPFVAVNIGGVHENLMESELFGHEKGSFTGADARKIGLFELAGAGSLFLDEIGEMPLTLQIKLLRVLQERKITQAGRHPRRARRGADTVGDEQGHRGNGPRGAVPRGSLLSGQRRANRGSAASRAARGHRSHRGLPPREAAR